EERMKKRIPLVLPCHPCPYDSSCCNHGVGLTDVEAARLEARFGARVLRIADDGERRTEVASGKCVFHAGGVCTIHGQPEYPSGSRGSPWPDGDAPSLPYQYDLDACGALTNDMDRTIYDEQTGS